MNTPATSRDSNLDRFISPRELTSRLGLSTTTLWRLRRSGAMPEPVQLSANRIGWSERAIVAWVSTRAAAASHDNR
ncbi:MAG: AlpA family phage regulatory protein [Acidobacteriota bacterium]